MKFYLSLTIQDVSDDPVGMFVSISHTGTKKEILDLLEKINADVQKFADQNPS